MYRATRNLCTLLVAGTAVGQELSAQSVWMDGDIPGKAISIQQVFSPPGEDRVYFCGMLRMDSTNWTNTNPVLRYSDGGWDTLGVLRQMVRTVVEYHDTLIAAGDFQFVDDSLPVEHVTFWDSDHWEPYGSFQMTGARKLRVIEDTLYAVGSLATADGQVVHGVTRRIGGHWEAVGEFPPDFSSIMMDIVKHDGKLVVIGSGHINGELRVFVLEDGVWSILGDGIQGGLCSAQCLAVYQGQLYVGGQITMACGNPGQGILRWDGTAYQPVGLGLQSALGNNSSFAGPTCMVQHNGLLYVGGGFRYAGGVEAFGIATWDGIEWCGVEGNFTDGVGHNGVIDMAFYHDTLFVSANMVDGDSVNFACKAIDTTYVGPCTGPLSIVRPPVADGQITVRVVNGSIHVQVPADKPATMISLRDASGRLTGQAFGKGAHFGAIGLPPGLYIVSAEGYAPQRTIMR